MNNFHKYYFMMNKIKGTVCSSVSDRRETVFKNFPAEILAPKGSAKLHTIGRLDADTEGLLILTTDGVLSNFLTRPENKIQKKYYVELLKKVDILGKTKYSATVKNGIILPPEKKFGEQWCSGAEIDWMEDVNETSACIVTITEGKFHEIKRIFRALENEVTYLKRISIGNLYLDEAIKPGTYRELTVEEIKLLST